jgi:hypothetical protein
MSDLSIPPRARVRGRLAPRQIRAAIGAGALVVLAIGISVGLAAADRLSTAPPLVYSGIALDGGAPIADGTHAIGIGLFDAPTGGAALCTIAPSPIETVGGHFAISVAAAACGAAIQRGEEIHVELSIDGTLLPRSRVGAVPYAVNAERLLIHGAGSTISSGVWCGATAETTGRVRSLSGALGYVAARENCAAACSSPTAHMCSVEEMTRAYQLGIDFGIGWIAVGNTDYAIGQTDCSGWLENIATYGGMLARSAVHSGAESPHSEPAMCDARHPILCCD